MIPNRDNGLIFKQLPGSEISTMSYCAIESSRGHTGQNSEAHLVIVETSSWSFGTTGYQGKVIMHVLHVWPKPFSRMASMIISACVLNKAG